jgi:hypothetical protein
VEKKKLKNKKEININSFAEELLEYAKQNFSDSKIFDTFKAKKDFGVKRNIIIEAYAFGPAELREYKLTESKAVNIVKGADPTMVGRKGTIVIKKFFVDEFNAQNPENAYKENDSFDVEISADKIVLKRKK